MAYKYQSHGREGQEPSRINHLLGAYEVNPLPYKDEKELEASMSKMNLIDIQKMAIKIGLVPTGDRKKLCKSVAVKYRDLVRLCGVNAPKKEFNPNEYE